jgi:hypothetical protein
MQSLFLAMLEIQIFVHASSHILPVRCFRDGDKFRVVARNVELNHSNICNMKSARL